MWAARGAAREAPVGAFGEMPFGEVFYLGFAALGPQAQAAVDVGDGAPTAFFHADEPHGGVVISVAVEGVHELLQEIVVQGAGHGGSPRNRFST